MSWVPWFVGYLAATGAFLLLWSRGLPPAQNISRAVARFELQRTLGRTFDKAFPPPRRTKPELQSLLGTIDQIDTASSMRAG